MDPAKVLPPEVLLHVCSHLQPRDLVSLDELSVGWRRVARDRSLWRHVDLDLEDMWDRDKGGVLRTLQAAPCLRSVNLPVDPDLDEALDAVAEVLKEVRTHKSTRITVAQNRT